MRRRGLALSLSGGEGRRHRRGPTSHGKRNRALHLVKYLELFLASEYEIAAAAKATDGGSLRRTRPARRLPAAATSLLRPGNRDICACSSSYLTRNQREPVATLLTKEIHLYLHNLSCRYKNLLRAPRVIIYTLRF